MKLKELTAHEILDLIRSRRTSISEVYEAVTDRVPDREALVGLDEQQAVVVVFDHLVRRPLGPGLSQCGWYGDCQ